MKQILYRAITFYKQLKPFQLYFIVATGIVVLLVIYIIAIPADPIKRAFSVYEYHGKRYTCMIAMPRDKPAVGVVLYALHESVPAAEIGERLQILAEQNLIVIGEVSNRFYTDSGQLPVEVLLQIIKGRIDITGKPLVCMVNDMESVDELRVMARKGVCVQLISCFISTTSSSLKRFGGEGAKNGIAELDCLSARDDLGCGELLIIKNHKEITDNDRQRSRVMVWSNSDSAWGFSDLRILTRRIGEFVNAKYRGGVPNSRNLPDRFGVINIMQVFMILMSTVVCAIAISMLKKRRSNIWSVGFVVFIYVAGIIICNELPRCSCTRAYLSVFKGTHMSRNAANDLEWVLSRSLGVKLRIGDVIEYLVSAERVKYRYYHDMRPELYNSCILDSPVYLEEGAVSWRRTFWCTIYPRVKNCSDVMTAAYIISQFLQERMTICEKAEQTEQLERDWLSGIANSRRFKTIYISMLRSAGIAARFDRAGAPEMLLENMQWVQCPIYQNPN